MSTPEQRRRVVSDTLQGLAYSAIETALKRQSSALQGLAYSAE